MTTPAPTAGDDIAELFQHECCAIQIDFEDRCRWRLRRGDTGRMDQTSDVAQIRGRLDKRMQVLARGHVDYGDAHLVSGVPQDLCRRTRVVMEHVGQQAMLTETNPPRDRLPDLTSAPMTTITSLITIPLVRDLSRGAQRPVICSSFSG